MGKIDLNLEELKEILWCLTLINHGNIHNEKTMIGKLYHRLIKEEMFEKDLLERDKLHSEINEH